jgi:1-acyl-sn-glycerol-3-phosphate acyltransferase
MTTTQKTTAANSRVRREPAVAPKTEVAQGLRGLIASRAADWSINDYSPTLWRRQRHFWNFMMDHYFRLETDGWEKLPDRPCMFVGVHAGGTIAIDAWLFQMQWIRRFGSERILHSTAHDVLRAAPGLGDYFKAMGVLPPGAKAMNTAWEAGHDIVIFPGGEHDALRNFSKRDKAILGGRVGFIKVAMRAGVPIVPYATTGGSDSGIVLSEGRGLAKLVNAKKHLRTEILPIVAAPPFGVILEILPSHLPMPAKIRYEFQDPIVLSDDPNLVNDDAYLRGVYDQIEGGIQGGMDRLAARRSFPIFG